MTNAERAGKMFFDRAERILPEMAHALAQKDWGLALRRAQEVLELTLKGLLILMGVEYPREHDPSRVFAAVARQRRLAIPEEVLAEIISLSSWLTVKRAPAFYAEVEISEAEARRAAEGVTKMWQLSQEWKAKLHSNMK
jgi:HEPN domain-containing protein